MTSKDKAEWEKVQAYVSDRLSYWLPGVPQQTKDAARDDEENKQLEEEEKPSYQPDHRGYDKDHPCATDLKKIQNCDFGITSPFANGADGKPKYVGTSFVDPEVHRHFRKVLLSMNMHHCCPTCHKYGHHDDCRFGAPWPLKDEVSLLTTMDRRQRVRAQVVGPRNNHFINRHPRQPQCVCASSGNIDASFVGDRYGACVYCASYASKVEEPDCSMMANLIARSLSHHTDPSARDILRNTMNAMLRATVVGSTQACWFLLNLPYVRKTRAVINVNTLPRDQMTVRLRSTTEMKAEIAEAEDDKATAADTSPGTNIGRRLAYSAFVKNQLALQNEKGKDAESNSCLVQGPSESSMIDDASGSDDDDSSDRAGLTPLASFSAILSRYRLSKNKPKSKNALEDNDDQEDVHQDKPDASESLAAIQPRNVEVDPADEDPNLNSLFPNSNSDEQGTANNTAEEQAEFGAASQGLQQVLRIDETGELADGKDASGNFLNPRRFVIGNTLFQWMKNPVVINQSPYIPFSKDDDR